MPTKLLTVQETAELLSLSKPMVYKLMERGELRYVKIGRSRRVEAAAVEDLIRRHTQGGWREEA